MKTEKIQTETYVLTDLDRLDPVTVYVTNYKPGQGSMGERTREPWSIREEIDGRNAGWMTWIMAGDKGVAVCNNQARAATFRASKNESEANARLIVTAVNYHHRLREALQKVLDEGDDIGGDSFQEGRALLTELDNLENGS